MKYLIALVLLTLPAMLAANASCPMARDGQRAAGTVFTLTINWQTSPLFTDQVL